MDAVLRPQLGREPFKYAALDHQKATLRLIRILDTKSPEGYVRLELRHASIDDSYICLSYVWGEDGYPGKSVLLDNKPIPVRPNLYYFLERARQKERLLQGWLWIDALCIDQSNDEERNHQVQQMGLIFSRAKEVISWLGDSQLVAEHLEGSSLADAAGEPYHAFINVSYWYRAWITQEVALARRVSLCAGGVEAEFSTIRRQTDSLPPAIEALSPEAARTLRGRSLIYLLNEFDFKDSCDRRDRIYSLLALCGDGSDLQVNYRSSIKTVAQTALRCCKRSFCLCSIRIVAFAMNLRRNLWVDSIPSEESSLESFAYVTLRFNRGDLQSNACHFEFRRPCVCEATGWSHTPGFVTLSHDDGFIIVLYPRNFCRSYMKTRIEITLGRENIHPRWNAIAWEQGAEKIIEYGECPGCNLVAQNDTHYKVYFSFDFLVRVVYRMAYIKPCKRVVLQGTQDSTRIRDPVLRLCP